MNLTEDLVNSVSLNQCTRVQAIGLKLVTDVLFAYVALFSIRTFSVSKLIKPSLINSNKKRPVYVFLNKNGSAR